ncbi:hypothetical protein B5V46_08420 [Rhodovulum sp. MB263]|nr:hypothetical protein B5V46_08420 [Rhodovulum sp. MB263]
MGGFYGDPRRSVAPDGGLSQPTRKVLEAIRSLISNELAAMQTTRAARSGPIPVGIRPGSSMTAI